MLAYARRTGCKVLLTVPTFLEQWSVSQENVEVLKQFEVVVSDNLVFIGSEYDYTDSRHTQGVPCQK